MLYSLICRPSKIHKYGFLFEVLTYIPPVDARLNFGNLNENSRDLRIIGNIRLYFLNKIVLNYLFSVFLQILTFPHNFVSYNFEMSLKEKC